MKPGALILTPYYGGIDAEHMRCISHLLSRGWLQSAIFNCALLDHAYAALAGIALRQDQYDIAIFIEHDILFAPEEAEALVQTARNLDAMVGAPCIIKNPKGRLMVSKLEAEGEVCFGEKGKPIPCWGLPLGFTAIPIHWISKVCEFYFPLGPCLADNGGDVWPVFGCLIETAADGHRELMTQDYSFCKRLDSVGCKRYLDTRRRIAHKGGYPYTIEDACWSVPQVDDLRMRFVEKPGAQLDGVELLQSLEAVGDVTTLSSCGTKEVLTPES